MIKRLIQLGALFLLGLCAGALSAQSVTLTGTLQSSNGMPASNYSISFTPSQMGFVAGTAIIINTSTSCATSVDGSVVGVPNPLVRPPASISFTGTLPAANYFVKFAFYDAAGAVTLVSPETQIQLSATGRVIVASPAAGMPAGAVGMKVYISTSTNTETLQGTTTGSAAFIQSIPLVSGASVPSTNTTLCKQIANDVIWPSGTGYTVALTDPSGNTIPGYPMQWQLMGAGTTINLSNGLPYYHGTVYFPTPILASPLNHQLQSISGPLGLLGYNLTNVGALGVGTSLPAWPVDVENGFINSNLGYLVNGQSGTAGQCLMSGGVSGPNTWGTCLTSVTTFYQTIQANTTAQSQRAALNFSSSFAITDSPSPSRTTVDLLNVGTPGTYIFPASITTNTKGQVTAVTAGSATTLTCTATNCWHQLQDGTIEQWGTTAGCTTSGAACSVAVTFPHSFTTTTNLVVTAACSGGQDNCNVGTTSKATTGFNAVFTALVRVGGSGSELNSTESVDWHAIGR